MKEEKKEEPSQEPINLEQSLMIQNQQAHDIFVGDEEGRLHCPNFLTDDFDSDS